MGWKSKFRRSRLRNPLILNAPRWTACHSAIRQKHSFSRGILSREKAQKAQKSERRFYLIYLLRSWRLFAASTTSLDGVAASPDFTALCSWQRWNMPPRSALPEKRAFRARLGDVELNRRDATDAATKLLFVISAFIAPLRFSWIWVAEK